MAGSSLQPNQSYPGPFKLTTKQRKLWTDASHPSTSLLNERSMATDQRLPIQSEMVLSRCSQSVPIVLGRSEIWPPFCEESYDSKGILSTGAREACWETFLSDPLECWNHRSSKRISTVPDPNFVRGDLMWLVLEHSWVEKHVLPENIVGACRAAYQPRLDHRADCEKLMRVAGHERNLRDGTWSNLHEQVQLIQAVATLDALVHLGYNVDNSVFYGVLKRSIAQKDLVLGSRIHALALNSGYGSDTFLSNHIICMYASHGRLDEASHVFKNVAAPNCYMWASIILAHARHGQPARAIQLYRQMRESSVKPDNHIYVAVLKACASAEDLSSGKEVHEDILTSADKPDMFVRNCLVDMYAKCGSLEDAQRVFDNLTTRDVVTWTAMIAGYTQHGRGQEALALYDTMQQECITPVDSVAFLCLLKACGSIGALHEGKKLHAEIMARGFDDDVLVGNCLVDMYCKCGSLEDARRVFDNLPNRDVVTWNAMIAGYTQHGLGQEALALYASMQQEGVTPADSVTFVCLLQACGNVGGLEKAKEIHGLIPSLWHESTDLSLGNALIDMYSKCGSMVNAQQVFDALPTRDTVTWNTLLAGYACQGETDIVHDLFQRMKQEGKQLDGITFLSVLMVCSYAGLVDKGQTYFEVMSRDYGITPTIEHYTCMLDLLGRAGQLHTAMEMARKMSSQPPCEVWKCLLGACQKWSNVELGRQAFEYAVSVDESDAAIYVLMANIYSAAEMHLEAQEIQAMRVKAGAWKFPGQSWWTDVNGVLHTFVVGERAPPRWHRELEDLLAKAKEEGYISNGDSVLQDIRNETGAVCGHSEKLSIAPGVTAISGISKDCHTTMAHVPTIGQQIVANSQFFKGKDFYSDVQSSTLQPSRLADQRGDLKFGTWSRVAEGKQLNDAVEALNLLVQRGNCVDNSVFYGLLKRCIAEKNLAMGSQVHALAVRSGYASNAFLANHIICMYAFHGRLKEATQVFSKFPTPSRYMWASIIMAHARHGQPKQAITLYRQMRESTAKTDDHIFVAVLKACTMAKDLSSGREVHANILGIGEQLSIFVGNCLVDMYAKCGSLNEARMVFDSLPRKNVVTWTVMIAGYAQHGLGQEALSVYDSMQQEGSIPANHVTFVCLLQACASARALDEGKQLHVQIQKRQLDADVVVGTCLVDMYVKCGSLFDARKVFDHLPNKNVVTWNAMIAGYAQHELGEEALSLYESMQYDATVSADAFTFVCLLQACSNVAGLEKGKEIHAQISKLRLETSDLYVANALVDMYCKCGSMFDAHQVFDALSTRDVVTWNTLMAGYARQGQTEFVFDLFFRMKQEAIQPDAVTFLSVLSACSHVGLVDKGRQYFEAMIKNYEIAPTIEVYSCMIDLLGRAGEVDRAMELVRMMPLPPDSVVWSSVLGACQKWSKVELGRKAFESAVHLGTTSMQQLKCRKTQRNDCEKTVWKKQGQSW